jgi:hypothetical protein
MIQLLMRDRIRLELIPIRGKLCSKQSTESVLPLYLARNIQIGTRLIYRYWIVLRKYRLGEYAADW